MVKKKAKKETNGANDFASFMKSMQKDGIFVDRTNEKEEFYKLGEPGVDGALRGGLPVGQIYSFQGAASSGKSLAGLSLSKSVVESGRRVMYLDTENKISQRAIRMMGLADNELFTLMASEGNLEDTLDVLMRALESDLFGLIAIDSVDALTTDEQDERDIHDGSKVGGYKAKILSEWLGKVSSLAAAHKCSVLLVRQVRDNPNAMYGSPETTSGGRAIDFYATNVLRFAPNKEGNGVENGKLVYQGASIQIKKLNQGARPDGNIPVRFYIGDDMPWGFDKVMPLFNEATRLGIWYKQTPTSTKYLPSPELLEATGLGESDLTFIGRKKLTDALYANEDLVNIVSDLVDQCDGVPLVQKDQDIDDEADFEEIDE